MTDEEYLTLAVLIREHWPETTDAEGEIALRSFDGCDIGTARQAITSLRAAMPGHQKHVDPQRLLAVCRQLSDASPLGRQAVAQSQADEQRRRIQNERQVTKADFDRVNETFDRQKQLEADAVKWCEAAYPAAWKSFNVASKARLVKIRVSQLAGGVR